jgi:hypothetical protein
MRVSSGSQTELYLALRTLTLQNLGNKGNVEDEGELREITKSPTPDDVRLVVRTSHSG